MSIFEMRSYKNRFFCLPLVTLALLFGCDSPAWATEVVKDSRSGPANLIAPSQLEESSENAAAARRRRETNRYAKLRERRRVETKELETCSWLVTYRDRVYDLAPLTRKSLDRPLEGDVQSIIRRVPAAAAHLDQVDRNDRDAKVHTAIATAAVLLLVGTRIAQGGSKTKAESPAYMALNIGSVLLFARAAYAGWELKQESKREVARAVQEFNTVSEDPMEPYQGGL